MTSLLDQYKEACNYPGKIVPEEIELSLGLYLKALGIERKIVCLKRGWKIEQQKSLFNYIEKILKAIPPQDAQTAQAARDARAAQAALDARAAQDARAALQIFACWCINRAGYYWWNLEISWLATTYLGALETKNKHVQAWSKHIFEAFLSGLWGIHFTDDTLYWYSKPKIYKEKNNLHREDGPAIESDLEDLFFWHGTLVTKQLIMDPLSVTQKELEEEKNSEVSRAWFERLGPQEYFRRMAIKKVDVWLDTNSGLHYELYDFEKRRGDLQPKMLKMESPLLNDGTQPVYIEPVHPGLLTAQAARRWQFMKEDGTWPDVESCNNKPELVFGWEA